MNILHNITYTVRNEDGNLYEMQTKICRNRRLTEKGCERILNRERTDKVTVIRVEIMIDER